MSVEDPNNGDRQEYPVVLALPLYLQGYYPHDEQSEIESPSNVASFQVDPTVAMIPIVLDYPSQSLQSGSLKLPVDIAYADFTEKFRFFSPL
ncbi:hypothetical protein V6N12_051014 [Hibiscus sabdariffa]|uniref:Uncharacterized protein n=1 Tax=Hibiscus sabdariffa TaxID=183260 RepID=A0ABR2GF58_9ROSI